jgi:hypothetical protein
MLVAHKEITDESLAGFVMTADEDRLQTFGTPGHLVVATPVGIPLRLQKKTRISQPLDRRCMSVKPAKGLGCSV